MQRKTGRSAQKKLIKLSLLVVFGCLAYFAGNYYAQKKMQALAPQDQVSK